jgi:hypothetical protein
MCQQTTLYSKRSGVLFLSAFFFFSFSLLLLGVPFLHSQDQPAYRIGEDGSIIQRLSWSRTNAYYYIVEIEKQSSPDTWVPESQIRAEDIFIEISLGSGMYRYRIISYNVLGRPAASSEWTSLRIYPARDPAAEHFSPASFALDSNMTSFTLVLSGTDLFEEARVRLAAKNGEEPLPQFEPESVSYSPDSTRISAVFSTAGLSLGDYDIVIVNPGGFEQRLAGFSVGFKQKIDIALSLGYAPLLPLGGWLVESYTNGLYPAGFYARLGLLPLKREWGSIGAEIVPSWAALATNTDNYNLGGEILMLDANALYQRWFNRWTMALKARLGLGIAMVSGIHFEYADGSQSEERGSTIFTLNAGASFEWLLWRGLFVEAGANYTQGISAKKDPPGLLRITAGAGWKW